MKLILILLALFTLSGCSPPKEYVDALRDDAYTEGCVSVVEKLHAVGYFTTSNGGIEVIKLKCSENLPEGYKFEHKDDRFGFHGSVGHE